MDYADDTATTARPAEVVIYSIRDQAVAYLADHLEVSVEDAEAAIRYIEHTDPSVNLAQPDRLLVIQAADYLF